MDTLLYDWPPSPLSCTLDVYRRDPMRSVTVREARENLRELLDACEQGEEILVERRGKPIAKLTGLAPEPLESRASLRATLPAASGSAADLVRAIRDEERS